MDNWYIPKAKLKKINPILTDVYLNNETKNAIILDKLKIKFDLNIEELLKIIS